ncbi:hypothetical protein [Sphingomonas sp. 3-13AW]|uniref:hypothetical protein n=1 Tax=Sphingomonas sp. 3-13AW TaxID=3050450 RepID=UPI003BB5713A
MKFAVPGFVFSASLILGACGAPESPTPQPTSAKVLSREDVMKIAGRGRPPVTKDAAAFQAERTFWKGPRLLGREGALMLTESRKQGDDRLTRIVLVSRVGGFQDAVVRTRCDGQRKGFQLISLATASNDLAAAVPSTGRPSGTALKIIPEELVRATCADRSKGMAIMGTAAQASAHARAYMEK